MSMPALLAHDLVRTLGSRRVLDGVSLVAAPGQRIGLIGENGTGKTTLLRLLAGADVPDSGSVVRPESLGFLHQELPFPSGATLSDVLDDALREARLALATLDRLAAAMAAGPDAAGPDAAAAPGAAVSSAAGPDTAAAPHTAAAGTAVCGTAVSGLAVSGSAMISGSAEELLAGYGTWLERAEELDAWDADRRATLVMAGLGLGHLDLARTVGSLSGGERGRLALAALLVRRPAALLLDEPTNHLDDAAAAFLEEELRGLPGVVLVASHDRAFLDAACTDLIDLDPATDGPTRYGGGYTAYQAAKRAERERWQRRFSEEQDELTALRHAASVTAQQVAHGRPPRDGERMGYGHTAGRVQQQVSRRVRNAARRLKELERTQVRKPPKPLRFAPSTLAATSASGSLISLRDVRVPGRLFLDRLDVSAGDRILITGPNGAGKSTLLAVLAGRLHPASGAAPGARDTDDAGQRDAGAAPGPQSTGGGRRDAGGVVVEGDVQRRRGLRVALLTQDTVFDRPDRLARDLYAATLGPDRAEAVPLGSLGLLPARAQTLPVGELSVGQRRRLALALVIADPPELLLLDEPTNHLSPRLADELEDALAAGPGAIVVASHDRWLRSRWPGREVTLTGSADATGG
ncbi:macrolide transport system ATP-binding/permease protein [Catenuloplanes nepalensis]|uniref:Macrolide transport system ATP-binding/permease protein n=1 Tax=Catenuloplanes nepalensis TaxID=587533 RepID=A0ABT9MLH0_9ACTN|nr:ABC-F family ATP-binding cassette domain-containing protein [Catenuloplanes nepalensis]MDP9792272.1 macrolide transport system ATP-binding/permease protein [Catenuloplanes nepalensis]